VRVDAANGLMVRWKSVIFYSTGHFGENIKWANGIVLAYFPGFRFKRSLQNQWRTGLLIMKGLLRI
jgi:hypothetical protein